MAKRLLSYDPLTGRREWFEHDPLLRVNHIHTEWDKEVVDQIIANNHDLETDGTGGWSNKREFRRVASIPFAVLDIWKKPVKEGGKGLDWRNEDHWPGILAELNSNEFRGLRTAPGVLGKRSVSTPALSKLKDVLSTGGLPKP